MYDHMDDVKSKWESGIDISALPCAKYILKVIGKMEKVLKKYYTKTLFPTVYGNGMVLNPRTKLIIFKEESWADTSAEEYSNACHQRFLQQYDQSQSNTPAAAIERISSSTSSNKRSAAHHDDPEYRQALPNHLSKRRRNDFDRYINDPDIPSALGWWRDHYHQYPDKGRMVRDVLAVQLNVRLVYLGR